MRKNSSKVSLDDKAKTTGQKIQFEISIWIILASVLPMTALGVIGFAYIIGVDSLLTLAVTVVLSLIFATSIIWWWWTAQTIIKVSRVMLETSDYLKSLKENIKDIRQQIDKK